MIISYFSMPADLVRPSDFLFGKWFHIFEGMVLHGLKIFASFVIWGLTGIQCYKVYYKLYYEVIWEAPRCFQQTSGFSDFQSFTTQTLVPAFQKVINLSPKNKIEPMEYDIMDYKVSSCTCSNKTFNWYKIKTQTLTYIFTVKRLPYSTHQQMPCQKNTIFRFSLHLF